jgi:hypothetical protein
LLVANLAGAATLRAGFTRRAWRRAGAGARLTALFPWNLDRALGAGERLVERDLEVESQVGAARRPAAPAGKAAAEPEKVAENIREVRENVRIEAGSAGPAGSADAGMPEAIVARALVAVAEHRVGFGGFLEPIFRLFVAGISVRMVLQRQLSVRALDVLVVRGAADAQDFVVVPEAHALATFTCAGLRSREPIR